MGFHEVQFPVNISYGSEGGPGFNTSIIETDSGAEQRISRWSTPRHRYNIAFGIRTFEDLYAVREFYIARRGAAWGFRFKDYLDFTSASDGVSTSAYTDQTLGTGDGILTQFQLVKKYTSGGIVRTRKITKPIVDTTSISFDDVDQGSGWTVNTTTGIVTFSSAPSNGVVVKAGFEFDVPVRFGKEVDELLSASIDSFGSGSIVDMPLVEIISEVPISDEFYFGGAKEIGYSDDVTLTELDGRVIRLTPTVGSLKVFLPDLTGLPYGGPYFYLYNSSAYTTLIRSADDDVILSLATTKSAIMIVMLDISLSPLWAAIHD